MRAWIKQIIAVGLICGAAAGCTHLQSVSITPIPAQRSRPVSAQVEKLVILLFNFSNDYVEELPEKLRRQCPDGVVSGILTKHYTVNYVFAHKVRVEASGFCTKKG